MFMLENFKSQAHGDAIRWRFLPTTTARSSPAQVLLTINYHTKHTSAEKTYVSGQEPTVRHEHREDKKEKTIPQLLLIGLLCSELAAMVLRPKLVSLNVERRRHQEVIESVVGCAQNIAAEIEAEGGRRGAVFPHINVEIKSVSFKWQRSELEMVKERKMLMIKKMLKEFRVGINGMCALMASQDSLPTLPL
ncbi:hypothetical protein TIFTF001_011028 [Ficus carica]|uniref:Uncharacterized protein n=1 Tax=Ficus carica TaxID=3494 RepID=A0AA87ZSR8_FICCA|nr:hypothetical protein TIFTF001_011028 [Ficus carica]